MSEMQTRGQHREQGWASRERRGCLPPPPSPSRAVPPHSPHRPRPTDDSAKPPPRSCAQRSWGTLACVRRGGGGSFEPPKGGAAQKHSEAGDGRPVDRGVWTAKTVKRPPQQPAQPPIRQLLGAADTQTAHPATFSTAPAHQLLGSANAETTPAGAPAAAADRTQRPDATCEGQNG